MEQECSVQNQGSETPGRTPDTRPAGGLGVRVHLLCVNKGWGGGLGLGSTCCVCVHKVCVCVGWGGCTDVVYLHTPSTHIYLLSFGTAIIHF